MEKKMLNTYYEYELADGSTVKLTLCFYKLLQLKTKNKKLYERYNKVYTSMQKTNDFEEINLIFMLYVAYVCANMDDENLLSEEEFMILCGGDRVGTSEAYSHLTNPKKIKASADRSN